MRRRDALKLLACSPFAPSVLQSPDWIQLHGWSIRVDAVKQIKEGGWEVDHENKEITCTEDAYCPTCIELYQFIRNEWIPS
jgi:hypothetical protein